MPKSKRQKGVTLIELMMTMLVSSVVVLTMAILLADNLRGWRVMYGRLHSIEADNTYVARLLFDKAVRRSSHDPRDIVYVASPLSLTVKYYSDAAIKTTGSPDRKAVFSYDGANLKVEDKDNGTEAVLSTWTIPRVSNCIFRPSGRALEMVLTLNNPSSPADNRPQSFTIFSSAYLHSQ